MNGKQKGILERGELNIGARWIDRRKVLWPISEWM